MKKNLLILAFLAFAAVTRAELLPVPNASFEAPDTTFFSWDIADWGNPGFTGTFSNTAGFGNQITNADGDQMAFMNGDARNVDNNLYVDLNHLLAPATYTLTVGVAARSDSTPSDPANTKMELRLFTRVPTLTILAKTEVVYSDLSNTELTYYSATLNAADIPASALGQGFGIWLDSTEGTGGDWTLDNVTLTMIPEPATMLLMGLGGLGLLKRRS
mgnify:CR=1 FL=1